MENVLAEMADIPTTSSRHTIAGVGLLLSGPETLLTAIGAWKHQIPDGPRAIEHATELLSKSKKGAGVKQIKIAESAVILRRLMLIRVVKGDQPTLEATDRELSLLRK